MEQPFDSRPPPTPPTDVPVQRFKPTIYQSAAAIQAEQASQNAQATEAAHGRHDLLSAPNTFSKDAFSL